ncbi:HsdM family class I SAM-dependent methyltransferase [Rickettsiella endosymbiont of Dermanyssus gallinae]|uniref:HsdM family class I SAM-dependent methyltransferase n=1 Tax=Rickettsiella endosymbiont of Dermanyssus gallinae TaxID=2856608 RepID=UPI001C528920|nr:N-6 DNA methylase [Rickettsiella endosymbiont of Dermanyssus gallinae]
MSDKQKNSLTIKGQRVTDDVYYQKAIKINQILHDGSINKSNRVRVVATTILALLKDSDINRENDCLSMINELNNKAEEVLHEKDKREFIHYIKISVPPIFDNHIKFKKALLETLQVLESINICSSMNSGTDILGIFYEKFLKYGNAAKEMGIVFTPKHITRFAVEVLNITNKDKVLDPACGTGGFLISALDKVKNEVGQEEFEKFKSEGIYGIEQDPEIAALALVNMIFRGSSRVNLEGGNCFTTKKFMDLKVSKVLMNPPFSLKNPDEKEYKFIDFALNKMEKRGYLFAIIPNSVMLLSNAKKWRAKLLEENTLKAVITLPGDLFYPVNVCTYAIIIQKGVPHKDSSVMWAWLKDGLVKRKGIMVSAPSQKNNIEVIKHALTSHLNNVKLDASQREFIQKPINYDSYLEYAPESYLEDEQFSDTELALQTKIVVKNLIPYYLCKQ